MSRPDFTSESVGDLFRHPPVITTERLILRSFLARDAEDMYEYASRPDVVRYLKWEAHSSLYETKYRLGLIAREYKKGRFYDWAVVLRGERGDEGKMIDSCGFTSFDISNRSAEIGYVINPAYAGRGYATEAVCRVLRFAFCELGLHRVEARYATGNAASRRVMEKCGMRFEGVLREAAVIRGEPVDVGICSILSREFLSRT